MSVDIQASQTNRRSGISESSPGVSPRVDAAVASGANDLRIGIMGGTFDPIHYGHLICAEQAREQFELDFVVFIPTGQPSFKLDKKVTGSEERYEMACIATRRNEHFDVSRMEIDRDGVTYSYDTILELRSRLPERTELFFIAGADAIISLPKWYRASELATMVRFLAATRPGYDYAEFQRAIDAGIDIPVEVSFFEVPGLDISSTDLRARIADGSSALYMLPMSVLRYIDEHGLYLDWDCDGQ